MRLATISRQGDDAPPTRCYIPRCVCWQTSFAATQHVRCTPTVPLSRRSQEGRVEPVETVRPIARDRRANLSLRSEPEPGGELSVPPLQTTGNATGMSYDIGLCASGTVFDLATYSGTESLRQRCVPRTLSSGMSWLRDGIVPWGCGPAVRP